MASIVRKVKVGGPDQEPCCGHPIYEHESISFRGTTMSYCWQCKNENETCYMRVVTP